MTKGFSDVNRPNLYGCSYTDFCKGFRCRVEARNPTDKSLDLSISEWNHMKDRLTTGLAMGMALKEIPDFLAAVEKLVGSTATSGPDMSSPFECD